MRSQILKLLPIHRLRLSQQIPPLTTLTQNFTTTKAKPKKQKLNFNSDNTESYNGFFTLQELKEAIQTSHNTAVNPDKIHYEFLKQVPPKSLDYLLNTFNYTWKNSSIPESWKLATIISIPKPGKNNLYSTNYHPIALTSCLCKTMERMVNKRLVWYMNPTICLPTPSVASETKDLQWIMWSS